MCDAMRGTLASIGLPAVLALAGCQASGPQVGEQDPLPSPTPSSPGISVSSAWVDGCDISVVADEDYAQAFDLAQVNISYEVSSDEESLFLVFTGDDNLADKDEDDGGGAIQIGQSSTPSWHEVVNLRRTAANQGTLKLNNFKFGSTMITGIFADAWIGPRNISSFGSPNNNTEYPIVQIRNFTADRATLHIEYRGVTVEFVLEPAH